MAKITLTDILNAARIGETDNWEFKSAKGEMLANAVAWRTLGIVGRREACYGSRKTKAFEQQEQLPKSVADGRRDDVLKRMGQTPPKLRKERNPTSPASKK